MRKNYNTLHKYIYDNSTKEYNEKTVTGLFRAITEPVINNQQNEALILVRILKEEVCKTAIKRLRFSACKIISYSDDLAGYENNTADDIWESTEFLVLLTSRYSAALIWDYSTGNSKGKTQVCLLYNSKRISEIAKTIEENSVNGIKDLIIKYAPDRRDNMILNESIRGLADKLNETNEEIELTSAEKDNLNGIEEEIYKTAQIVTERAKYTAHEIKNNLSIINIYTKILEKRLQKAEIDEESSSSVNTSIKNIRKASETISYIINELRCYSKPNISEVDIKQIIASCIEQTRGKAQAANVKITASNIADKKLTADRSILECCIINIIFNAIDACKSGCAITINTYERDLKTVIQISNNGEKISKDIWEKIFDQDFTTKQNGSGAGLYICRKQLENINGEVKLVNSDENETIFEITV